MQLNLGFWSEEMDSCGVTVFLYKGLKHYDIPLVSPLTTEEIIFTVAKHLGFLPISLNLFGLRIQPRMNLWLPQNYKFGSTKSYQVEFRMRFRLPALNVLSRLDENAFDYVFHQIRYDLLNSQIPELCLAHFKPQALGLCTTDMKRAILEDGISRDDVVNNYRQYIPKSIYNKYFFVLKKKIQDSIPKSILPDDGRRVKFLKQQYVNQVENLAPSYFAEEFTAMTFKDEEYPTTIRIDPFQKEFPGLSMAYVGKQEWEHLCSIEDLCFISMRVDCTVEISRKNGIPICFKFKMLELANSFVSLLDGYYRLCEKWTFNLCKDLLTPSLIKLKALKCHGPVGQKFSHQKLATHPSTKRGWFILRQSSLSLVEHVVDFINENKNRPHSMDILFTQDGKFKLENQDEQFSTLGELISYFTVHETSGFYIKECLPPSEYDQSPLLLCRAQNELGLQHRVVHQFDHVTSAPQVISPVSLQVYRGKKFEYEGKVSKIIKAVWKQNRSSSCNVAIKFLKKEHEERLMKDFLEMASRCVLWQCESLVQLKGVVLGYPQAMILEWMSFGPLDLYLQNNSADVTTPELIEATCQIAKAVWFLEDNGIVHGNIRCHSVLVHDRNDNVFIVKLSDPSILEVNTNDIHWIPPEFFEIPSLSKTFVTADVWALGTTIWEVFSYGSRPPMELPVSSYKAKYLGGWRLARPEKCPSEIQRIISECWSQTPDTRKQPQAIVRDIHQILYQLVGTKRGHSYAAVSPASSETGTSQNNSACDITDNFNWATFSSDPHHTDTSDGTLSTFIHDVSLSGSNHSRSTQATWLFQDSNGSPSPDLISGFSEVYTSGSIGTVYSTSSALGIYEFRNNQVTLGRMIGQGFYGAVYLGEIVRSDGCKEHIAIKRMKDKKEHMIDNNDLDFIREFEILQKLCHPNIVELKGVVYEPDLLLIMEYLPMGSLLDYFKISYGRRPTRMQLLKFAQDVAEGMDYLSENNIVHRDLAARNLLVANDDLIKISDFGLARFTDNDNCYTVRTRRHFPIKWYPPESLEYGRFSEQSDIWSYGVTLFEIFSYGLEPILPGLTGNEMDPDTDNTRMREMLDLLNRGVRLPCPEGCPQSVYTQLMLPCWNILPQNRPSFRSLLGDIMKVESNLF